MAEDIGYKGDDFDAFGGDFMSVTITNETKYSVNYVIIQIGKVQKRKDIIILPNESKSFSFNLSSKETKKLMLQNNEVYAACFDELGRKLTCQRLGDISFNTKAEVVSDGGSCC